MRAIRAWLSLFAMAAALLGANPGMAHTAGVQDRGAVARASSHCDTLLDKHQPAGGKQASPCAHCVLCGVFFTAAPAIPTAARTPQSRRFAPAATKVVARGPDRRGAHRARASPTA